MHPRSRRILQAVSYEGVAILFIGPVLAWMFDHPVASAFALSAIMSTIALAWNYLFNTLFERWETRQTAKGRSLRRRLAHGLGFEGGLLLLLVPLMAYWLETTLFNAFLADLGIFAFFFLYTIGFTWTFDRMLGLPQSAT